LYGRLSQWSNEKGRVYRSTKSLTIECGFNSTDTTERSLKELRDLELIGTYQTEKGGVNNFEFYQHPWMDECIKDELCYKSDPPDDPTANLRVPHRKSAGTPTANLRDINIKEIKVNKTTLKPIVDLKKSTKNETGYKSCLLFMAFYNIYPNKQKPQAAYRAFQKLKPNAEFVEMLIKDVKTREFANWEGRDKRMIPHPATYLNQREWEGDINYPMTVIKPAKKIMDVNFIVGARA
jgi:hypothetical protein